MGVNVITYGVNLRDMLNSQKEGTIAYKISERALRENKLSIKDIKYLIADNDGASYVAPSKSGFDGSSYRNFISIFFNEINDLLGMEVFDDLNADFVMKNQHTLVGKVFDGITITDSLNNEEYELDIDTQALIILFPETIKSMIESLKVLSDTYQKIHDIVYGKNIMKIIMPEIIHLSHFKDMDFIKFNALLMNFVAGKATLQFSEDFLQSLIQIKQGDLARIYMG